MHLLRHLLSNLNSRPKAHLAVVFIAVSNHLTVVALAASPAVLSMPSLHPTQSACGPDSSCDAVAGSELRWFRLIRAEIRSQSV